MNLRSWGHGTIRRGSIFFRIDTSQKSTDSCLISFYLSCISTKKGVMLPHGGGYFTTFNFWKILLNIRKRGHVTVRGGHFFLALIWVKYRILLNLLCSAYVTEQKKWFATGSRFQRVINKRLFAAFFIGMLILDIYRSFIRNGYQ